jgi:hypothetical protein
MEEWKYSSTILHLGTRGMRVESFMAQPLYLRGESFKYPFDRMLVGPQSKVWSLWNRENSLVLTGN